MTPQAFVSAYLLALAQRCPVVLHTYTVSHFGMILELAVEGEIETVWQSSGVHDFLSKIFENKKCFQPKKIINFIQDLSFNFLRCTILQNYNCASIRVTHAFCSA
jgi:hypothetical protein